VREDVCAHICMRFMYVCICIRVYVYIHFLKHAHVYTSHKARSKHEEPVQCAFGVCMYVCRYVRMHVYVCTLVNTVYTMYIYAHTYVYVCKRTYTHHNIHVHYIDAHRRIYAGKVLSRYLVSTGNFTHPVSRRPLTRAECVALDDYMTRLKLGEAAVTHAYDLKVGVLLSVMQQTGHKRGLLLFGRYL
jgi:hypothetical protein